MTLLSEGRGCKMDSKHEAKVVGVFSILLGVWLSLSILRGLVLGGIWQTGGTLRTFFRLGALLLSAGLAAYLIGFGWRMLNAKKVRTIGFGWGKIIFGTLILYIQAGLDFHLVPDRPSPVPKPSSLSALVWDLIVVCLIFRGIWEGFSKREPQPIIPPTPNQVDEGQ
jgi:hypothetical protein